MSCEPLLPVSRRESKPENSIASIQRQLYRFLTSKTAHYSILLIVSLDVACLFADIIISLFTCGHRTEGYEKAMKALGIIGLTFSSLFVLELLACIWAFGPVYFKSKFHCFDATVIIASLIVEITLQGVTEEIASLVVIL
ncbi:hypothetical protein K469DRAFT_708990 [Zopfia rhizophila CBS 207.26]|uniref:Voltage-gated hydrogen channel 1 n=1 Tax=Zopfia rhizophila CBS 207.26 TaxID=1314779 RepID=A0A6A6E2A2_9PEZI|nr:hypothetical protein K469DRAFT_708990 [Zopfia rhizophila CBS 207.26]